MGKAQIVVKSAPNEIGSTISYLKQHNQRSPKALEEPIGKSTSPGFVSGFVNESRKKYAGPRFCSPPAANLLPRPPPTWFLSPRTSCIKKFDSELDAMTLHLRQMLKMSTALKLECVV